MENQPKDKRFYGRRQGKKLRKSRQFLVDELLPKISIPILEQDSPKYGSLEELFSSSFDEFWLEVGFGGGEHLKSQSLKNKNIGIIGSEVYLNGIASLLAHLNGSHEDGNIVYKKGAVLEETRSDNVRIFPEDVRKLLPFLPNESFEKIFVLFPDPWPKKKHEFRRFIGEENLPEISRLLKKGGILRVASDDMNYIRWSLRHLNNHKDFEWKAKRPADWRTPPKDWEQTRYEQKAIKQGKKPIYLDFVKK